MSNFDNALFVDRERKYLGFQKLLQPTTRQAVMLIEAPKDMGKTWVIGKIRSHCQDGGVDVPVAHINFRNPRQIHEIQDFLGLIRLLRDELNMPHYFYDLNRVINQFTAVLTSTRPELISLSHLLEQYFNLDELAALCFRLGINFENLPGQTLTNKVLALIRYCERHKRLPDLIQACRAQRPEVQWPVLATEPADAGASIATENDTGAPLQADSEIERTHAERQISQAFFEGLARLIDDRKTAVFLFDSFEAAPPVAERWVIDQLLLRLRDGAIPRVIVVITGRKTPDLTDHNLNHLVVKTGLSAFNETYIREYFEQRRKINGLDYKTVTLTSGGVPGILAMMAEHALLTQQDDDDFFADL